jgi:hypothetical protein
MSICQFEVVWACQKCVCAHIACTSRSCVLRGMVWSTNSGTHASLDAERVNGKKHDAVDTAQGLLCAKSGSLKFQFQSTLSSSEVHLEVLDVSQGAHKVPICLLAKFSALRVLHRNIQIVLQVIVDRSHGHIIKNRPVSSRTRMKKTCKMVPESTYRPHTFCACCRQILPRSAGPRSSSRDRPASANVGLTGTERKSKTSYEFLSETLTKAWNNDPSVPCTHRAIPGRLTRK